MAVSFDRAVDFYDQTRGYPVEQIPQIAAFIAQTAGLHSESQVIEIGVGTGRIALPLSQHVGVMFGLDLSHAMMDRARNKTDGNRLLLSQASADFISFASHSFDAIILVHILHLVPDLDVVMLELQRIIRPNGKLIHCWNLDNPVFQEFHRMWNKSTHRDDQWSKSRSAPPNYGWQQISEPQTYTYPVTKSPQQFVDEFKNRVWSSTWALSDELVEKNVARMQAEVNTRYPNPDKPLTLSTEFIVDVYTTS